MKAAPLFSSEFTGQNQDLVSFRNITLAGAAAMIMPPMTDIYPLVNTSTPNSETAVDDRRDTQSKAEQHIRLGVFQHRAS